MLGCALLSWLSDAGQAQGAITAKDLLIALRTLSFVTPAAPAMVELAVLYNPVDGRSTTDLQTVLATLDGRAVLGLTARPVALPLDQMERVTNFRFVLITSGLEQYQSAIFERTRGRGIVTIASVLSCVESGWCVLGISAEPRIEVMVNGKAAEAAGVQFDSTFLMLIREQ